MEYAAPQYVPGMPMYAMPPLGPWYDASTGAPAPQLNTARCTSPALTHSGGTPSYATGSAGSLVTQDAALVGRGGGSTANTGPTSPQTGGGQAHGLPPGTFLGTALPQQVQFPPQLPHPASAMNYGSYVYTSVPLSTIYGGAAGEATPSPASSLPVTPTNAMGGYVLPHPQPHQQQAQMRGAFPGYALPQGGQAYPAAMGLPGMALPGMQPGAAVFPRFVLSGSGELSGTPSAVAATASAFANGQPGSGQMLPHRWNGEPGGSSPVWAAAPTPLVQCVPVGVKQEAPSPRAPAPLSHAAEAGTLSTGSVSAGDMPAPLLQARTSSLPLSESEVAGVGLPVGDTSGTYAPPPAANATGGVPSAVPGAAKSRYRGVSYDRKKAKWRVQIKVAALGKSGVSVGYYDTEDAAGRAYDRAAIGLLGVDSAALQTNFPLSDYAGEAVPRLAGRSREEVKAMLKSERIKLAPRRRFVSRQRTSRYAGVGSSNRRNQWQARILVHGKVTHLGYYETEEAAARVYDRVALALHGAGAQTNFAPEGYAEHEVAAFRGLDRAELQRALGVKPMDKSSRFRGVSKKKGKWEAKVMVNRRWAYRELFDSEEEAARAYDRALWRLKPREAASYVNFKDDAGEEGVAARAGPAPARAWSRGTGDDDDEDDEDELDDEEDEDDTPYDESGFDPKLSDSDGASSVAAGSDPDGPAARGLAGRGLRARRGAAAAARSRRVGSAPDLSYWAGSGTSRSLPVSALGTGPTFFVADAGDAADERDGYSPEARRHSASALGKRGGAAAASRSGGVLSRTASEPYLVKQEGGGGWGWPAGTGPGVPLLGPLGEVTDLLFDQDFFGLDLCSPSNSPPDSGGTQPGADVDDAASSRLRAEAEMDAETSMLLDFIKGMPDASTCPGMGKSRSALDLSGWPGAWSDTEIDAGGTGALSDGDGVEDDDESLDGERWRADARPRKMSRSASMGNLGGGTGVCGGRERLGPLGRPIRRVNTFTKRLPTCDEAAEERVLEGDVLEHGSPRRSCLTPDDELVRQLLDSDVVAEVDQEFELDLSVA